MGWEHFAKKISSQIKGVTKIVTKGHYAGNVSLVFVINHKEDGKMKFLLDNKEQYSDAMSGMAFKKKYYNKEMFNEQHANLSDEEIFEKALLDNRMEIRFLKKLTKLRNKNKM